MKEHDINELHQLFFANQKDTKLFVHTDAVDDLKNKLSNVKGTEIKTEVLKRPVTPSTG